jgi:hypothetical protein
MERRDLFRGWWSRVAIAALALLILGAGLCLFDIDQHHDGPWHHAGLTDLCCLAFAAPAFIPLLAGLDLRGLAASIAGLPLLMVALVVPSPPPRQSPSLSS